MPANSVKKQSQTHPDQHPSCLTVRATAGTRLPGVNLSTVLCDRSSRRLGAKTAVMRWRTVKFVFKCVEDVDDVRQTQTNLSFTTTRSPEPWRCYDEIPQALEVLQRYPRAQEMLRQDPRAQEVLRRDPCAQEVLRQDPRPQEALLSCSTVKEGQKKIN